jgi:precorrin isomerase
MTVHPIEAESYRILASRVDLRAHTPGVRAVIERVIHASADLDFATTMVLTEDTVRQGVAAIRAGAPVIADVEMVRAGINGAATCLLSEVTAGTDGVPTRSAMAVRKAADLHPRGAIWVVGCAPTALAEIVALTRTGQLVPALVIGLPVGFVGAADAKAQALTLDVPVIANVGEKGGSAVAAAAFNSLRRLADEPAGAG